MPLSKLNFQLACLLISITGFVSAEEINHSKFIAQRAAMESLEGEDPLQLRESWWKGKLEAEKAKLVQQQLFKKNTYQFWLAVPDPGAEVLLNLYDSKGELLETEKRSYSIGKNVTSLIVTPEATGTYYLRLALSRDSPTPQEWAMIYAFK